ncbi:MAG TPA: hypothetical protein ENH38_08770, partial [Nitrospirae bacterium]|nr:hypothetical protein [Nitrospirota bacterium]
MDISFERLLMEPAREFFKKLIDFLPNMLSSLIIIITGLICAYIVKYLFIRFLRIIHFDKFCERVGVNQILQKGGIRNTPSHITGRIIYWLFVSIFIIIALNSLRVPSVEDLMTKFLLYLPNVFVAMIIIIFGYLIGNFLGRATL